MAKLLSAGYVIDIGGLVHKPGANYNLELLAIEENSLLSVHFNEDTNEYNFHKGRITIFRNEFNSHWDHYKVEEFAKLHLGSFVDCDCIYGRSAQ